MNWTQYSSLSLGRKRWALHQDLREVLSSFASQAQLSSFWPQFEPEDWYQSHSQYV